MLVIIKSDSDSSSESPTVQLPAAGAGAFFVTSYSLPPKTRMMKNGKYLDNDGHITVAGETLCGGGSSVDSQSEFTRTTVGDAESSISSPME
jgi:hypothetical protein